MASLGKAKPPERFDESEAERRTEAALRAAFNTPHKTYEESKVGKGKAKPTKSPRRRRPVEKRR
jgi:hypothetical protein